MLGLLLVGALAIPKCADVLGEFIRGNRVEGYTITLTTYTGEGAVALALLGKDARLMVISPAKVSDHSPMWSPLGQCVKANAHLAWVYGATTNAPKGDAI